jgi:hypothetical protein
MICFSLQQQQQDGATTRQTSGLVLSEDHQTLSGGGVRGEENGNICRTEDYAYSSTAEEQEILRLKTSLLTDRLEALEAVTRTCQSWQTAEKGEYERCMSDLAAQVTRALSLQQLMRSEVEKLQQRVIDLESHNRAMATMIIPTLVSI